MRRGGRMHAVGEHVVLGCVGRDEVGLRADQRRRGAAGLRGRVHETVGGGIGDDLVQQPLRVDADSRDIDGVERREERAVEQACQRGDRTRDRRPGEGGRLARVGDVADQDVLRAGSAQHAHLLRELGGCGREVGLRLRGGDGARLHVAQLHEQVVGARPDRVDGVTIQRSLGEQLLDLRGDWNRSSGGRCGRIARRQGDPCAAVGIVVATLVCRAGRKTEALRKRLRPDRAGVGREHAGAGRQHRFVRPHVGQAVAEEVHVAELRHRRRGQAQCQRRRERGAGEDPHESNLLGCGSVSGERAKRNVRRGF